MLALPNLADFRVQQQIAHEIYRQQIMQRLPDPFPTMLPYPMAQAHFMPPQPTLPGVEAKLENNELWQQFHKIGTEMIITKSGRRMFPSMRVSLSGLEEESNYCVLLEMVPIGDCRYKFSGSQWVPAGGAEPQSPQRMYLHPDSPARGSHWQTQPLLFNKVKLTNNTLDNSGQVVLASMHKYQPRIHVIRTAELSQIPWAPQQAFVFPETEFVAVTAYQNDRITKLKIDNNPFAKGFRESGQSRCKRKLTASPDVEQNADDRDEGANETSSSHSSPQAKRLRSSPAMSLVDDNNSSSNTNNNNNNNNYAPEFGQMPKNHYMSMMDANMRNAFVPHFYAASAAAHTFSQLQLPAAAAATVRQQQQQQQQQQIDYARHIAAATAAATYPNWSPASSSSSSSSTTSSPSASILDECESQSQASQPDCGDDFVDVVSTTTTVPAATTVAATATAMGAVVVSQTPKRSSFSILDILGNSNTTTTTTTSMNTN